MSIKYEIESRSDFLTGMYLTARIPDSDVDNNALRTIQQDCPEFILPFNYKSVNGQTEFTYKVGALSKLQYFYGEVSIAEYIALWKGVLRPLLECRDWFMNPNSFVLDAGYLYFDKAGNAVAYVYIPSKAECSGYEAFKEMAVSIARNIKVADPVLENKVLRSIINDFSPGEFLKMLLLHAERGGKQAHGSNYRQINEAASECADGRSEKSEAGSQGPGSAQTGDDGGETSARGGETSARGGETSARGGETSARGGETSARGGETSARGGKSAAEKAAAAPKGQESLQNVPGAGEKEHDGFRFFSSRGKRKKAKPGGFKNAIPASVESAVLPEPAGKREATQETKAIPAGTGLRCIGRAHYPQAIEVEIADGEVFTIGRFDAGVGKKRSSFEFEAKTKAVSRRHAAIERDGEAYKIVDLSSSAGTYVNDKKIPPSTPARLENGYRVSFGNLGADYVWNRE